MVAPCLRYVWSIVGTLTISSKFVKLIFMSLFIPIGKFSEYQLPYQNSMGSDPSAEDVRKVVVDRGERPLTEDRWMYDEVRVCVCVCVCVCGGGGGTECLQ